MLLEDQKEEAELFTMINSLSAGNLELNENSAFPDNGGLIWQHLYIAADRIEKVHIMPGSLVIFSGKNVRVSGLKSGVKLANCGGNLKCVPRGTNLKKIRILKM